MTREEMLVELVTHGAAAAGIDPVATGMNIERALREWEEDEDRVDAVCDAFATRFDGVTTSGLYRVALEVLRGVSGENQKP